jgi:hypothetical protein
MSIYHNILKNKKDGATKCSIGLFVDIETKDFFSALKVVKEN